MIRGTSTKPQREHPSRDKKSKACTAVGRLCGLSTVVTPAGASLTMYREIRPYANSIWDDNNNNNIKSRKVNIRKYTWGADIRKEPIITKIAWRIPARAQHKDSV